MSHSGLVGELHRAGARRDVDAEEEPVGIDDVGRLVRRRARSIPARSGGARSPAWVTGRSPSPRARSAIARSSSSPISEPSASRPTASPIHAGFSHTSKPPPTSSVGRQPGSWVATSRVGSMRTHRTPNAAASAGCHDCGRWLRSGSVGSTTDALAGLERDEPIGDLDAAVVAVERSDLGEQRSCSGGTRRRGRRCRRTRRS